MTIFGLTSVAAFWINAIGHVWMLWRGNPLVHEHKATLEFRSALLGDALLLPLVNVLLDRQLEAWGDGLHTGQLRRSRLIRSLFAGSILTVICHVYQAKRKMTNWTMPRPWRWTALGYYHALYMAGQFTILAYFAAAARTRMRTWGSRVLITRRLLTTATLLTAFARLLYNDYH